MSGALLDVATAAVVGLVLSGLATGVVGALARRRGILDEPDPARRTHAAPTPRLGGVGVLVGLLAAVAVVGVRIRGSLVASALVAFGGVVAFAGIGLADDLARRRGGLPARVKLLATAGVATLVVLVGGVRFDASASPPWPALPLGGALAPLTVLWLLAVVHLVNFMDGIDGISGVLGAVLLALAAATCAAPLAPVYAAGCGALVGFLAWNAPPRSAIFLGDGGAYLLGGLVALAPCAVGLEPGAVGPDEVVPLLPGAPWPALGAALVPSIVDVGLALLHKLRLGIPVSQPHHDHLYQRLVRSGSPAALVALRYGALSVAAALVAGPLAVAIGPLAASAIGLSLLALHLATGARSTRSVPRLVRERAPS